MRRKTGMIITFVTYDVYTSMQAFIYWKFMRKTMHSKEFFATSEGCET